MADANAAGKSQSALVFVYNADSGLFNTLADMAHKALSPQTYRCQLCALTHGHLGMRREWKAFLEELGLPCEFLHRDELATRYGLRDAPLPAVYRKDGTRLRLCLDDARIAACRDLAELKSALRARCTGPVP